MPDENSSHTLHTSPSWIKWFYQLVWRHSQHTVVNFVTPP